MALKELKTLSEEKPEKEEQAKNIAAALLQKQFIQSDSNSSQYRFISQNKRYFENLFDALQKDLVHDVNHGYFGIVPRTKNYKIKLIPTLMLLILRRLYDIEASEGRLVNGCKPTTELILTEYQNLVDPN